MTKNIIFSALCGLMALQISASASAFECNRYDYNCKAVREQERKQKKEYKQEYKQEVAIAKEERAEANWIHRDENVAVFAGVFGVALALSTEHEARFTRAELDAFGGPRGVPVQWLAGNNTGAFVPSSDPWVINGIVCRNLTATSTYYNIFGANTTHTTITLCQQGRELVQQPSVLSPPQVYVAPPQQQQYNYSAQQQQAPVRSSCPVGYAMVNINGAATCEPLAAN